MLTQTPGGLYELFSEKAGRAVDGDDSEPPTFEDRPDVERRIAEVAAEFGIEIPPPSQTRLGIRRQAKGA